MVNEQTTRQMFSGPVPGESLTKAPKSMPYERPPQFTKLDEAMNFVMNQLLEPEHFKELISLMKAGMPVEAIVRTVLFGGFASGKWTPDLAILMYKPLFLTIMAIAHKANLKDTPLVMKENLDKFLDTKNSQYRNLEAVMNKNKVMPQLNVDPDTGMNLTQQISQGFMQRPKGAQ